MARQKAKQEKRKKARKKADQPRLSLADRVSTLIGPILIMLMIGSLSFFLVEAFYKGFYDSRLRYILFFYSCAVVLVSRISITIGKTRSLIYGAGLASATAVAVFFYVENPYAPLVIMAIMWWCAKKLTWDCTLANEEEDASGEGLLQITGLEKRLEPAPKKRAIWKRIFSNRSEREGQPHAPGLWILYFSLAAVPIFGLGQFLIETTGQEGAGAESRRYAFKLLGIYLASSLALLLTTSLLGLKRYLKQREVDLTGRIVRTWISFGLLFIALIMGIGFVMPRPDVQTDFQKIASLSDYLKVGSVNRDEDGFFGTRYDVTEDDPDLDPNLEIDVPLEEEEEEEKEPDLPENEEAKKTEEEPPVEEPEPEETPPEEEQKPEPEPEEKPEPETPEEKKPEELPMETEVAKTEPEPPKLEMPDLEQLLNMALTIPEKLEYQVMDNVQNSQYADLNNDGHVDAVFSMPGAGTRIWLNNGSGTLVDTRQILGADGSHDPAKTSDNIALGDLDQDKDIDILLVDSANGSSVWLNDGTGKFAVEKQDLGLPVDNPTFDVVDVELADIDKDGDLDGVLVNKGTGLNLLLPNAGGGKFESREALSVPGTVLSTDVAIADLNDDSLPDIVFSNANPQHPVDIWMNEGNRRFKLSDQVFDEGGRNNVAVGDLDNDSDLDLMLTNVETTELEIWLNDQTAHFTKSPQTLMGEMNDTGTPNGFSLEDIDQDGDLDAIVSTSGSRGSLQFYMNEGPGPQTGSYYLHEEFPFVYAGPDQEEAGAWRIRTLDWDGDRDLDIILHGTHNNQLYTFLNTDEDVENNPYYPTNNQAGRAEGDDLPSTFTFGATMSPEQVAALIPPEEEKPEDEAEEEEVQQAGSWNWPLILLLLGLLLLVGGLYFLANKYKAALMRFYRRFLNLFRKKKLPLEEEPEPEVDEEGNLLPPKVQIPPPPPPKPFKKFQNPFAKKTDQDQTNAEVVCYTFSALESWAHEQEHERPPEQTPMEFCYSLEREYDAFDSSAKKLSRWYTSYAYADREPEDECRETLEKLWGVLENPLPEPEAEIAEMEPEVASPAEKSEQ